MILMLQWQDVRLTFHKMIFVAILSFEFRIISLRAYIQFQISCRESIYLNKTRGSFWQRSLPCLYFAICWRSEKKKGLSVGLNLTGEVNKIVFFVALRGFSAFSSLHKIDIPRKAKSGSCIFCNYFNFYD